MGTTKHAEKPKAKGPVKKTEPLTAVRLVDAVGTVEKDAKAAVKVLAEHVASALKKKGAGVVLDQEVLAVGFALSALKRRAEGSWKVFGELLKQYRDAGGAFENGRYDIQFQPVAPKPSWKDEAIRLAEENAKLQGKPFIVEEYEATFKASVTGEPSCSVKITEAITDSSQLDEGEEE